MGGGLFDVTKNGVSVPWHAHDLPIRRKIIISNIILRLPEGSRPSALKQLSGGGVTCTVDGDVYLIIEKYKYVEPPLHFSLNPGSYL